MLREWSAGNHWGETIGNHPTVFETPTLDMNWYIFDFFVGIRILSGKGITDALSAKGLGFRQHYVDIYSSSWGLEDNGFGVAEAGVMTEEVLRKGAFEV